MKKRSGRVLKFFVIGVGVFLGVILLVAGGLIFVFGEDIIEHPLDYLPFKDSVGIGYESNDDFVEGEDAASFGGGGGGGGGGAAEGGIVTKEPVCLRWEPVQYSIGDFDENIECLVYGIGICNKIKGKCYAQVKNLDDEVSGTFDIRFSLSSGGFEEAYYEIVSEEIGAKEKVLLGTDFEIEGEFDMASLEFVIDTESVPQRCFEWE